MKSQFIYGLRQKVGKPPVIKKLGARQIGMEQTPVIFKGVPYLAESRLPDKDSPVQYIRIYNLETGEYTKPFGQNYYFASAYAEGDTLYVFASSLHDDKKITMYEENMEETEWHDPRGGHTIRMFKTKDLKTWEEKDIITVPQKRFWNTSVCKGENGYVMAIEVTAEAGYEIPQIAAFTSFFAVSKDLETWEMLDDEYSYTSERYNACPTIRFADGYYYMICLEALPCLRYASYIYRTKNFLDWEVGLHNPIMMFDDDDRKVREGCSLTDEELVLLKTGLNINNSDIDLFEYNGKTVIFYASGDQMSYSFLCEAEYDGPLNEFLKAFFQ